MTRLWRKLTSPGSRTAAFYVPERRRSVDRGVVARRRQRNGIEWHAPNGSAAEHRRPADSVDCIAPRRHMGENLSDQCLEFLVITPKGTTASRPHATPATC